MKTIDNKGRGNCMYYAYGISLMYHLRAQNKTNLTKILGRLPLSLSHRSKIMSILNRYQNISTRFNARDTAIIQDILGPACRDLASQTVKAEFLNAPQSSSVYTAAAYQFFIYFKTLLTRPYQQYIETGEDEEGDYVHAEVFKVAGMYEAMEDYAKTNAVQVQTEFEQTWAKVKAEFIAQNHRQEKIKLMDTIIQRKTIEFFQANQNTHLNRYIRHLNTDTTWGSEETLLSLHRALSGEKAIQDPITLKWSIHADPVINLRITENGRVKSDYIMPTNEGQNTPHIILNNEEQAHWVSIIPNPYLTDLPLSLNQFYREKKPVHRASTRIASKDIQLLENALSRIKSTHVMSDYKIKFLELFTKSSDIQTQDLSTASAKQGESDAQFAERLQIAEIQSLRNNP